MKTPPPTRILLVEDGSTYAELATILLEKLGYVVLLATDAEAGILRAREEAPDLVLMDLNLPGMDGFRAVGLVKQDPRTSHIRVVAMTTDGSWDPDEPAKAKAAGFDGYFSKPIDARGFRALLEPFLGRPKGGKKR